MCRRSGLERKRKCGWLNPDGDSGTALVWARKHVSLQACPKSYISAESSGLVEEFFVRRQFGRIDVGELSARQVEAFVILEKELAREIIDGQHNTRHTL